MRETNTNRFSNQDNLYRPGHDPSRNNHHRQAVLDYFRALPKNLPGRQCPSTSELTHDGRFGLRPPNRINELMHGKHDGHAYDFERISFGHGEYRWRFHEPNRPGYPKDKRQSVLPLAPGEDWYTRQTGKPRPPSHPWKAAFSPKRLSDSDCFELTPPEPRQ